MILKKSYGQHLLHDQGVLQKIVRAADMQPNDQVLEIGPGTGALTRALLEAGARVVAVEADREMVGVLTRGEHMGSPLQVIQADILSCRIRDLIKPPYKLVANLPYNITSSVLEKFLTEDPRPELLVVMVQYEVAKRVAAKPGETSVLSVMCQMYADVSIAFRVGRGAFTPPPKIESAVLIFKPKRLSAQERERIETVLQLVKAGFSTRRKQLHRALDASSYTSSKKAKNALEIIDLAPTIRAQELTVEQWRRLHDVLPPNRLPA